MKTICKAMAGALGCLLLSGTLSAAEPRWETLSGKWNITGQQIAPVVSRGDTCLLADYCLPWDTEWLTLSVDFSLSQIDSTSTFGILLHAENKDDYHLLRITPGQGRSTLQMLRWQYGYFRQWQEARFPALETGHAYNLSIVRAPVIDREDWRPWKILITDKATGKLLLKESAENHMPAFGLGITGLYSTTSAVHFSEYVLDRPQPENMAGSLRLPMVFSNGMVFQREQSNPVWGQAEPRANVEVSLGGKTYKTRADASGAWKLMLDPMPAGRGLSLQVRSGKNNLTIGDVAVGEVWMASGQSNMEMKVWESNVPQVKDPDIRLFTQFQWSSQEPMFTAGGRWKRADEELMPRWSAVAFAFAQQLKEKLGVPVGIVGAYFGGTAIESWVPRSELAKDSLTKPIYDRFVHSLYQLENHLPMDERFPWCWDAAGQRHTPGDLYNGMVYPHIPFGVRGIIWYQGETSSSKARQYSSLFPMLVDSWRAGWGNEALPFYYVQLAGYDGKESGSEHEGAWPHLRDVQRRLLDQRAHTGMTVAFHLGDSLNIHPPYKLGVGSGLANLALHDLYGFTQIVRSSPLLDGAAYEPGRAVLNFRETAQGLKASDGKPLQGFLIAGQDRTFYPAQAEIAPDGVHVIVSSPQVASPVAVRYGWVNFASPDRANLVNSAGLPAAPFRTDQWPMPTDENL